MFQALVITPVKNSIESTIDTIISVGSSSIAIKHIVYNDFSDDNTKHKLEEFKLRYNYDLIHLEDLTTNPSPNYKLVLQDAQRRALEMNVPFIVVESDVIVRPDTFEKLLEFQKQTLKAGLIGAITTDASGNVNFPYLKFKSETKTVIETKRSLSFCCTFISLDLLEAYNFIDLDASKDWYDTFISMKASEKGFRNFVLSDVKVVHKPHGSRPWKQLKYTNPLKYYFLKLIKRRDKI